MPNLGTWFGRIFLFLAGLLVCLFSPTSCSKEDVTTNHWLVELHHDVGPEAAMEVAKRTGFTYVAPMLGSPREFHFIHNAVPNIRMRRSVLHTRLLKSHPMVKRAVQQLGYVRAKRGFKPLKGVPISDIKLTAPDIEHFLLNHDLTAEDITEDGSSAQTPNDPLFAKEWYLKNTGQSGGILGLDLNVEAAWAMGYTGKEITTAIMDDGIDYLHEDLKHNYNAKASYDFSSNDPYPYPRYTDTWFNSHGTRCAGEVSAARDNKVCGVGVAYDSKVAGLRMLDQPFMTDLIEANAMGHMSNDIDIYSASWGPTDDGKTVDGPRNMTMRAIVHGVNEGRHGLGNIYVWASGDGGADDDCNCDGYAASMWTISINSATNDGQTAGYDESCSSTLASTFSNGKSTLRDAGVATTDLYNNCTTTHSGTSAAAPEAAGVFALALEAKKFATNQPIQMHIDTDACHGSDNEINYLEHVQAFVTLKSTYRGNVVIFITSPMNTTSMILSQRPNDDDHKNGFTRWPFMTTHTWAENPHGRWKLEITLVPGKNTNVDTGTFFEWTLIFHGTRNAPYKNQIADEMNHGKLFKVKRIHQEKA
ncbi:neuroendocrine convertase 2-like [Ylistrum balloti]|uniref:neuroendocrine convertase 2-like n=1 Tax=Ylistrum balloti TaxID=509963 RepID=UPI002905F69A|nr:neuroendocrine convertase 2-like [Ylistrum balloti]